MKRPLLLAVFAVLLALAAFHVWPEIDLAVARVFYEPGQKFPLALHPVLVFAHSLAYYGARVLGAGFGLLALCAYVKRKPVGGVDGKAWLFLFLALALGPVLIANVALKDHWNRARPHEVLEFGGAASFSPALEPQFYGHKNASFIAGDPAFGFYLANIGYIFPVPSTRGKEKNGGKDGRSRRFFWAGIGVGVLFGAARIMMGAHFLSDVLFAALFMLAAGAGLHAVMFGGKTPAIYWRDWLFANGKKAVR